MKKILKNGIILKEYKNNSNIHAINSYKNIEVKVRKIKEAIDKIIEG